MATYVDILKSEFPEIDSEVFDYITGERPVSDPLCTGEHPPCSGLEAGTCYPAVKQSVTALSHTANVLTYQD